MPLLACSSGSPAAQPPTVDSGVLKLSLPDAGSHADAAKDVTAEAGFDAAVCTSPDASTSLSCGTLAFAASPVTSRPRNHHVTLLANTGAGPMLYAIGGFDGQTGDYANVDRVPLAQDGSLGTWVSDTPIPFPTGGMVGEVVTGTVVVAGGTGITEVYDQAYSAVIQSDGSLSAWQSAGTVGEPRMHAASIVQGSTMWVLGGFDNQSVWSDIVSAKVTNGTVAAWAPAGQLPGPMSHFTATLVGDYVYLTGGLSQSAFNNPPELTNTWRGQIQTDGTLGGWTAMLPLPVGEATHAAFYYGGYLNVCGGINNVPAQEDRCWQSPIGPDHSLGTFEEISSLPIARGHVHQMPIFGTHVYSIAGAIDFNLDSTTEIDVGVFGTTEVMKKSMRTHESSPSPLLHHGSVCHGGIKREIVED